CLELHYRLFPNPHLLPMSFANLHERSVPLNIGHAKVCVLKADALLNYLVIHGAKHGWFRLKWLADLDRIVPTMSDAEFQEAIDFAVRTGCERFLATGLELLHHVYGSAPTRMLAPKLAPHVDEKLLAKMRTQLQRSEVRTSYRLKELGHWLDNIALDFALRQSWSYRWRQVELLLVDLRDIETFRLSSRWWLVYYVIGPFSKVLRSVARSIRSSPSGTSIVRL
ncbi:MAG TPA: nucleotidyltransferase family protein, partial [Hyphomicrobiaceae bacterium]|nr:nucleotidyltransferase family protein [Hyphomicrobiaceae bacterium]